MAKMFLSALLSESGTIATPQQDRGCHALKGLYLTKSISSPLTLLNVTMWGTEQQLTNSQCAQQ